MIFYPMFGQGLAMVLVSGLLMYLPLTAEDSDVFAGAFWTLASLFPWLAGLWVLPRVVRSIRWLRTLPVSAAQLAGVLIGAPLAAMLAFMGLGNVILGLVYPLSQLSLSAMLHQGCLPQMALATVLVPLLLWRGQDALVMTLVLLLLMGGAMSALYIRHHIPLPENLGAALLLVLGNFGLTRWLLARNSRVYRPRGGAGGGLMWFGNVRG
jgi:hypothetical protein